MGQSTHADVAELADALDSGSSARKGVEVQVLSSALVIFGVFRNRGQPRFFWCHPRGSKTGMFTAVKKTPREVIVVTARG